MYDFIWDNLYLYAFYRFYAEKQRFYRFLMRYYIKCVSLYIFLSFGHMILKNNRLYTFFMGAFLRFRVKKSKKLNFNFFMK